MSSALEIGLSHIRVFGNVREFFVFYQPLLEVELSLRGDIFVSTSPCAVLLRLKYRRLPLAKHSAIC